MDKRESLKEAGRLLGLYLFVAEYLAGKRATGMITPFLPDCFGAAAMGLGANLKAAQTALERAYDMLCRLSRLEELRHCKVLSGLDRPEVDCRPLIEDGCLRVAFLVAGKEEPPPPRNIAVVRWHAEIAGCLLQHDFDSEHEIAEVDLYELALMPYLMTAVIHMKDEEQAAWIPPPAEFSRRLTAIDALLPSLRMQAVLEPNPYAIMVTVFEETRRRLADGI
jgi:hypothetical protein